MQSYYLRARISRASLDQTKQPSSPASCFRRGQPDGPRKSHSSPSPCLSIPSIYHEIYYLCTWRFPSTEERGWIRRKVHLAQPPVSLHGEPGSPPAPHGVSPASGTMGLSPIMACEVSGSIPDSWPVTALLDEASLAFCSHGGPTTGHSGGA